MAVNIKRRMLIVDDEMEVLKIVREVFELRGWEVVTTPTAGSVEPILEKERIDIVLLDIRLPDGSGLDLLKRIKVRFASVPVIIFTAFGYKDDIVNEAISLGASGYVSKGVSLTELIETVSNTLVGK